MQLGGGAASGQEDEPFHYENACLSRAVIVLEVISVKCMELHLLRNHDGGCAGKAWLYSG
jgi:hypothetical protein